MKKSLFRFSIFPLILLLCLTLSCKQQRGKIDVEADIAAINEVYSQATLACGKGDVELYLSIFTEDAVLMATGSPAVIGKAELRPLMEGLFGQFDLELPYTVDEIGIPGDWAFVRSHFQYSMTPKEGGETTTRAGKELDILKRQADGSWKIYIECWNYGETPTEAKMADIACKPGLAKIVQEDDAEAIVTEYYDRIKLAYTTGDIDLYVGNYTVGAMWMPADAPIVIGSEQIRAASQPFFDPSISVDVAIYPQEAVIAGDWGFARCTATHSVTPKEGGAITTLYSKVLEILKRQADGSWKCYIVCWNSDRPPTVE